MAVPSYTHDLTDWILDSDTAAWGELTGAASGGAPDEADTESALQGTNSCSQSQNTTGLCSMCRILASPVSLSAGQVFLVWHGNGVATAMLDYASGGLRLAVAGSSLADWKAWAVGGNDVPPFPYAKWSNNPIDPTITAEYTNGTPPSGATNIYGVGSMCQLSQVVSKGQPHIVDIIRYGRAEARFSGGESGNYATFAGFAVLNDAQAARWGLIQSTTGGYLWKGLITLGYSSLVDFRDANKSIFVQDTRKVLSTFNKIEIRQATSRVDWTGISITCVSPSTTASRGSFETIDNATINKIDCAFTDMGTFIYLSNSVLLRVTYRRCDLVTQNGAVFTDCLFERCFTAVSLKASNVTLVTGCSFVSDGSNHAVEATTAGDYDWNNELTGYATSDGSTGNEAFYNNSGGHINLTVVGGTRPYVKNGSGATTTVIIPDVTLTISAPVSLVGAEIRIYDMNGTLPFLGDELAGTESHDAATYAYSGAASNVIWIQIMKNGYVEFGQRFTMPTASGAFFAKLEADTNE